MQSTEVPSNANEGCVGPSSSDAGKSANCQGCPNQEICASGKFSDPDAQKVKDMEHESIRNALSNINHIILVLSGKGGVGKSTVCCQLAHTLAQRGYAVGVLDVDICGPSVARMLGCSGRNVHKSGSGWMPVYANPNLSVMSISFLLGDDDAAVVWRGPRKNGLIKQFLTETCWDEQGLDYLLIDTPPGTSDEHISTVQYLQGALSSTDSDNAHLAGAIMVTTPEEVAMADVRKELNFCVKTKLPVIGIIENMSRLQTSFQNLAFLRHTEDGTEEDCTNDTLKLLMERCPEVMDLVVSSNVFAPHGSGPKGMAEKFNVKYLGALPLDPNLLKACEDGICFVQHYKASPAVRYMNSIVDKIVSDLPVEFEEEDQNMESS